MLPVSTVHLDNSSIYYIEKIWGPFLAVIASEGIFHKVTSIFFLLLFTATLPEQNDINVKDQGNLKRW